LIGGEMTCPIGQYALPNGGEGALNDYIEATYASIVPSYGPTQWDADGQEILLYYTKLDGA
jgi:hypothetical protein